MLHAGGHHSSADHGEDQHGKPAWDKAEGPEEVANRLRQAQFGNLAVEGMEQTLDTNEGLLLVGVTEGNKVIRGRGGSVEPLLVNIDGGRRGEHVEDPNVGSRGTPRIAKDRLVVAVHVTHVRAARKDGKLAGGLVEGSFNPLATTVAGLVPASNQNPPLDGSCRVGGNGLIKGFLPVVNGQDRQFLLAQLGLGGSDRVVDTRAGDVRAKLAEDVLEVCLVLLEEVFLSAGEDGQRRDES